MSEQQTTQERSVVVDDVSYPISELPPEIQAAIQQHDIWSVDRIDAQKRFAQLDAAVRYLSNQIAAAIKQHAEQAANDVEETTDAGDAANAAE